MAVLKLNDNSSDVKLWQEFLIRKGFLNTKATSLFGSATKAATQAFQQKNYLSADGIVGVKTILTARKQGYPVEVNSIQLNAIGIKEKQPTESNTSVAYPSPPSLKPLYGSQRDALLGQILFTPVGNQGSVQITNNWDKTNITTLFIPQLKGVTNPYSKQPFSGNIQMHKKVVEQTLAMFAEFEKNKVHKQILTWGGSYVPRLVRGSTTRLSNHAYGTAFDINMEWNGLHSQPALCGEKGCVRELAAIAADYGYYWGGHYSSRKDGMHFEVAKIM